jgi:hypothetical protein
MAHKDPVTEDVAGIVLKRDFDCVGPKVGMLEKCGSQFGSGKRIVLEIDHVNTSGFGKRGPSVPENLVVLCGYHHRVKTDSSKRWRAALNDYLRGFYEG